MPIEEEGETSAEELFIRVLCMRKEAIERSRQDESSESLEVGQYNGREIRWCDRNLIREK